MPTDPEQYDSALIASSDPTHWPKYLAQKGQGMKQTLANIPQALDRSRIMAYQLWNDIYRNRPEYFKIICRDDEEEDTTTEIYLPSAKKIVESTNRFLLVDFDWVVNDEVGSVNDQQAIEDFFEKMMKRERFLGKLVQQKRYCAIKGDALWHITADPFKRQGERISINELPPENYFPIEDPFTARIMGCHIVDVVPNPRNTRNLRNYIHDEVARRQTYRRVVDERGAPTGRITSELAYFAIGKWDDRTEDLLDDLELIDVAVEQFELPSQISQLPVYHIRNNPPQFSNFGVSEIAGIELLIKAMNQAVSDEDLTLVTQGLGVYWTDAAPPVDAYGNEAPWDIGPGKVVQVGADGNFNRVTGVSSTAPYQEHLQFLDEQSMQGSGISDVAAGHVTDTSVAESGIALQLKLGPLLAKNAEKELEWLGVHEQMFYDLHQMWLPAYEGIGPFEIEMTAECGDPMPQNRVAIIEEHLRIFELGIYPVDKLYQALNELGYEFEDGDFEQAIADNTLLASAATGGAFGGGGGEFDEGEFGDEAEFPEQSGDPDSFKETTEEIANMFKGNDVKSKVPR